MNASFLHSCCHGCVMTCDLHCRIPRHKRAHSNSCHSNCFEKKGSLANPWYAMSVCLMCPACIMAGDRNSPEDSAKQATAFRPWHANHVVIMHHVIECITKRLQWVDAAMTCKKQRWPNEFCENSVHNSPATSSNPDCLVPAILVCACLTQSATHPI